MMKTKSAKCYRWQAAIAGAIAVVMVAAGCVGTADRPSGRTEAAPNTFVKCNDDDAWARSEQVQSERVDSYYSVVFQISSCVKARNYPISIDMGPSVEHIASGKSMKSIGGHDGAGVFVTKPHSRDPFSGTLVSMAPIIPNGDGTGGFGQIAMFATVPYWEGPPKATSDQDPACANAVANKPGQKDPYDSPLPTAMSRENPCQPIEVIWYNPPDQEFTGGEQRFEGMWALYLPSETIVVSVVPPNMLAPEKQVQANFPFPYVNDSAIATGVVVARFMPGMVEPRPSQQPALPRQLVIYGGVSEEGYGTNPAGFVPTSCWDMVTLRDGNTVSPTGAPTTTTTTTTTTAPLPYNPGGPPTLWTFHVDDDPDEYPNTYPYDFVVSMWASAATSTNYLPTKNPVLFFPAGYQDTNDELYQTIPLRKPAYSIGSEWASFKSNENTSRVQRFLQLYLRNPAGDEFPCSSSIPADDAVVIGGVLDHVPWGSTNLQNAVLANSDMTGAALVNANLEGANLAYANLTGADLRNANLDRANLTGAILKNTKIDSATMKDANLFMADFTGADIVPGTPQATNPKSPNITGALWCQTKGIDETHIQPNAGCLAVRRGQFTAKQQVTPAGHATPDDIPSDCRAGSCVMVSVYNNSSRTYAQGLNWCANTEQSWTPPMQAVPPGGMPGQQAGIIAPLDSAQLMYRKAPEQELNCFVTFANGADGYYTIRINSSGTLEQATATIDGGACGQLKTQYSDFTCQPPPLDASKPNQTTAVVVNNMIGQSSNGIAKATLVDVMICDPNFPVVANLPTTTTTTTSSGHC